MTIRDFQNKIAEDLNGVKELVQNGCVVFAEDMLTTQNELNSAVATAGRIAFARAAASRRSSASRT